MASRSVDRGDPEVYTASLQTRVSDTEAPADPKGGASLAKGERTMEDEKPDEKTADNLALPTSLGKIGSKSEQASDKRLPSMPYIPEDKSEDYKAGYRAGYADGKNGKLKKF